jgi:plastocyanin
MSTMLPNTVRTGLAAAFVALLALPIAPAAAAEARVTISNFSFAPQTLTIRRGDTVRFVNSDDMVHTIVAGDGSFRSAPLDTGDSFVRTFARSGTIAYFCGLHPFMKGSIVVK